MNLQAETKWRVGKLVSETISNGDSLQALAKRLREDFAFSKSRAVMVARTETATAWTGGTLDAGRSQGRDEKRWVTAGDNLVTAECLENEDAGWIGIDDLFPKGASGPPLHPNCRCHLRTRTRPPEEATIREHPRCRCNVVYRHKPVSGVEAMVHEPRCKAGHRLPGTDVPLGVKLWCRKCKQGVEV